MLGFCVGLITFRRNPLKKLSIRSGLPGAGRRGACPNEFVWPETRAEADAGVRLQPGRERDAERAPDAAVITIEGYARSLATAARRRRIARRWSRGRTFEKLMQCRATQPAGSGQKKQIARAITQIVLYLAEKAHEAGLDQGPEFDEKMSIARLQACWRSWAETSVHKDAAKVTDGEIANYYQEHAADYRDHQL